MFDFWIGLRDFDNDNALVWTDESPVNFNNWHVGEPLTWRYVSQHE